MVIKRPLDMPGPEDNDTPDDDLWFLPGPPEDDAWDMPGSKADQPTPIEPREWRRAEQTHARALISAVGAFAALDERLRHLEPGFLHRIALMEVADLSWSAGTRLPVERIALHECLRISMAGDDAQALETALWALRRCESTLDPRDGLAEFLGRVQGHTSDPGVALRPMGADFDKLAQTFLGTLEAVADLHPFTRAAVALRSWLSLGLSGPDDIMESAVVAARLGAEEGRGGAPFVPVGLGDALVHRAGGPPESFLPRWYSAIENGCLRALLQIDRSSEWVMRAEFETGHLSGRTPPSLISALTRYPVLSADMVSDFSGVTSTSARRNLLIFEDLGLIREVTGQHRYRYWSCIF